mmetsp:Transcript_24099/g.81248  ORF Transcript_24099/g.81248 Transcript_24099/m.81248 type:complete len:254 (-) Transcript_24099:1420-2181(-)
MDQEDHVRGGPRVAAAHPHVAAHRAPPGPVLLAPVSVRAADGQLAEPPGAAAQLPCGEQGAGCEPRGPHRHLGDAPDKRREEGRRRRTDRRRVARQAAQDGRRRGGDGGGEDAGRSGARGRRLCPLFVGGRDDRQLPRAPGIVLVGQQGAFGAAPGAEVRGAFSHRAWRVDVCLLAVFLLRKAHRDDGHGGRRAGCSAGGRRRRREARFGAVLSRFALDVPRHRYVHPRRGPSAQRVPRGQRAQGAAFGPELL